MPEAGSTLYSGIEGGFIALLVIAVIAMWKEIKRLNNDRLIDMKTIGEADRKVISGSTKAINNLSRKIDGMNTKKGVSGA